MWILLVEDEERLARSLKRGLEEEGYTVDVAHDGLEGETQALVNGYDLLIVDWRLPGQDGKTLVENVRGRERSYPILMLTALGDVDHRVAGLNAGADDYLPKPFAFEELLARLRALRRRPPMRGEKTTLQIGPVTLDTKRRAVSVGDQTLDLRPKEFGLLELLMRRPGEVLSRTVIAERVWGDAFYVSDNAIDVTVSNLRQKLANAREAEQTAAETVATIETKRGIGYRLAAPDESE